jgi:hypothetical protein
VALVTSLTLESEALSLTRSALQNESISRDPLRSLAHTLETRVGTGKEVLAALKGDCQVILHTVDMSPPEKFCNILAEVAVPLLEGYRIPSPHELRPRLSAYRQAVQEWLCLPHAEARIAAAPEAEEPIIGSLTPNLGILRYSEDPLP